MFAFRRDDCVWQAFDGAGGEKCLRAFQLTIIKFRIVPLAVQVPQGSFYGNAA